MQASFSIPREIKHVGRLLSEKESKSGIRRQGSAGDQRLGPALLLCGSSAGEPALVTGVGLTSAKWVEKRRWSSAGARRG